MSIRSVDKKYTKSATIGTSILENETYCQKIDKEYEAIKNTLLNKVLATSSQITSSVPSSSTSAKAVSHSSSLNTYPGLNRTSMDLTETNTHQLSTLSLRSLGSDDLNTKNETLNLSYYDNLDDLNEFPKDKIDDLVEYESEHLDEIVEQANATEDLARHLYSGTHLDKIETKNSETHQELLTANAGAENEIVSVESASQSDKASLLHETNNELSDLVSISSDKGN